MDFARQNTHSNTDFNTKTNVNSGPVTTAAILYIRGTSEPIAHILQPYNICVAHKPITTGGADPGIFYWGGGGGGPNFQQGLLNEFFRGKLLLPHTPSHHLRLKLINTPWPLPVYLNSTHRGCIIVD